MIIDDSHESLEGKDAESEEAQEHANSSTLALYADCAAGSPFRSPIGWNGTVISLCLIQSAILCRSNLIA
jgi:hypothetical protein